MAEAATALMAERHAGDAWSSLAGFRSNAESQLKVAVTVGEHSGVAEAGTGQAPAAVAVIDGERVLFHRGEAWGFGLPSTSQFSGTATVSDGALRSPMPGRIVSVSVRAGERVAKGQTLLALEAMKMEHALIAPFAGTVAELSVSVGNQVAENVTLVRIVAEA
jgi:3-methylcrotonyl-CoA carboxylase alpha subunit